MKELLNLFREDNGNLSINRVIFAIGFLWLFVMTSYIVVHLEQVTNAIAFFSAIGTILSGLKLIQKSLETKADNQTKEETQK